MYRPGDLKTRKTLTDILPGELFYSSHEDANVLVSVLNKCVIDFGIRDDLKPVAAGESRFICYRCYNFEKDKLSVENLLPAKIAEIKRDIQENEERLRLHKLREAPGATSVAAKVAAATTSSVKNVEVKAESAHSSSKAAVVQEKDNKAGFENEEDELVLPPTKPPSRSENAVATAEQPAPHRPNSPVLKPDQTAAVAVKTRLFAPSRSPQIR